MKAWVTALLGAACLVIAQPSLHQHARLHDKNNASTIQARDVVTTTIAGPTVTFYKLGGQLIDYADVEAGLRDHKYIIEGINSIVAPVSTSSPSDPIDKSPLPTKLSSSTSTSGLSTIFKGAKALSTLPPATPPQPPAVAPAATLAPIASTLAPIASSRSGEPSRNLDADFPSGSIPCSQFPADYGPLYIDWLNLEGWTGVQQVPGFKLGTSAAIGEIITTVGGTGGCSENSFCSYACPPGYQKSQWPSAQGSTGQSIGGLFCNSNGMLELSRPSVTQLCTAGVGNIFVHNQLNQNVAVCRTDYPGLESETIPLNTQPLSTYPLTCPDAKEYFLHENRQTSAQYYVNPAGTPVEVACQWGSGGDTGNWAPVNLGVGTDDTGMTYIAMLPNAPTNPGGELNFTITISGSVSGECSYQSGMYWDGGQQSSSGCTVGCCDASLS